MDADLALALSLQLNGENGRSGVLPSFGQARQVGEGLNQIDLTHEAHRPASWEAHRPLSVVDESWELIDPIPNIRDLFLQFNDAYFNGRLAGVEVKWSPKMTLCAGVCSYEGRGGLCSIRLSEPLLKLRPRKDLVQTLLHEMIHALLFVTQNNKDHDSHGPEFHKHMYRINKQSGANITVYHSFHDEVNNYRQHWWKCDGPCQSRRPFFGVVRRAMNRAPSKNDTWWEEHLRTCGGTFHKIKEPEDYGKKSSKRKRDDDKTKDTGSNGDSNTSLSRNQDISKWFKPPQNSEKINIKTINDFSSSGKKIKKPSGVFTGSGKSLISDESSAIVSRDEWIERLIHKQAKTSKGKDRRNDLNKENLLSKQEQLQLKNTSTGSLPVSQDREGNCAVKSRGRDYLTFGKKKRAPETEVSESHLFSSSVSSSEPSLKTQSSAVSLAKPPLIIPNSVTVAHSSASTNTSTSANLVSNWKRDNVITIIDDPSPTKPEIQFVECPSCPKKIPIDSINLHLDQCLSLCA